MTGAGGKEIAAAELQFAMNKAIGGSYELGDRPGFWLDLVAVNEIIRRISPVVAQALREADLAAREECAGIVRDYWNCLPMYAGADAEKAAHDACVQIELAIRSTGKGAG